MQTVRRYLHISTTFQEQNRKLFNLISKGQRKLSKMRKQKNLSQLKEPKKAPEKKKGGGVEFKKDLKAFVKRMLTELGERVDENSENFNKELENIF